MTLKDFVSQTLVQIAQGVSAAQDDLATTGHVVSPSMRTVFTQSNTGGSNMALGWSKSGGLVTMVDFDVAITAKDDSSTKGGIGIFVGSIALGSQGTSGSSSEAVSRVSFRVPLTLNPQTADKET